MHKMFLLAALAAATALLAAAGASATGQAGASPTAKKVVISTRTLPTLGTVLVDSKGRTLYMFVPDKRKRVTCVKTCAAVWPPVMLPSGATPVAKSKAKAALLGSDRDPAGGRVLTYGRWPLYTYVADTRPGQAKGQAIDVNGGLWYVLAPSGRVIRKKA
jgi:predicted lipoprotein with Yx(FWY)xxD motif